MLFAVSKCNTKSLPLDGTWISKEDKLYVIKFDKNMFYEIYDNDTSSYKYSRNSESCDKSYLNETNEVNLDFISLDDGRCFEITSFSDSILVYRHTSSGKLLAFYKKN
jgi:hypothetical protein